VDELVRRLKALPDAKMRQAVLWEVLIARSSAEVVTLLKRLLATAEDRLITTLVQLFESDRVPEEVRRDWYRAAFLEQESGVMQVLRPQPDANARPGDSPYGRDVTLGHRKSFARRTDHATLQKVLRDASPAVVKILLQNPRLTEPDVVRLAARRPTSADVQREIVASKFFASYAVKKALALNPSTPADIAAPLVRGLRKQDLAELVSSSCSAQIRKLASELLKQS
jgi:hypothetical protein